MAIALSWSRISDWQQCPRKFYLKYVAKQFPPEDSSKSIHLVKGAEQHKQLENYVYAKLNKQDTSAMHFSPAVIDTLPLIDNVIDKYTEVWPERQVAVTYDFKPTEWFGADVAFRSIWDFSGINQAQAIIIDWKTGKVQDYDEECGQLHLSGAMGNAVYGTPQIDIFYAFIEYKICKPSTPLRLTDDDFPHIRDFFRRIYDTVNQETTWLPTVNQYCNYCPATKAQCQFSRKL
jgi:hypothetical protein